MEIRLASPLTYDSIVDGKGLRITIWAQGCAHDCYKCQNQITHNFDGGFKKEIDDIVKDIVNYKLKSGVTFSGGDPMFQTKEFLYLAKQLKNHNINIWCYTGFTWEELINNDLRKTLLNYIDVLVDGKFEDDKKSYDLKYKGSSNQRIIDVQKSLLENKIILFDI